LGTIGDVLPTGSSGPQQARERRRKRYPDSISALSLGEHLKISGSISPTRLLDALEGPGAPQLVIDLSGASWVQPVGLVGIAAIAESARREERQVMFLTPTDGNVANYVSRMRLGLAFDSLHVQHSIRPVRETDLSGDLLELTKVEGEFGGEQVANLVFERLERMGAKSSLAESLHASICEVVGNMHFHSGAEGGWVAAQTTHNGQKITFAIADSGLGLQASLRNNPQLTVTDDTNALQLAVAENISATGERGRGQGLPEVIRSSTGLNGSVHIASGTARAVHRSQNTATGFQSFAFPGTIIQVEL